MISTKITDGKGTGNNAIVDSEGGFNISLNPHPPLNDAILHPVPFAAYFTLNGSIAMNVNGSVAPLTFSVAALDNYDLYVKSITVQISAPSARLDRFGALPSLTNGIEFYYTSKQTGKLVIDEAIKVNLDFFRSATAGKGFGAGTNAWLADIAGGAGQDTYFPEMDIEERFGLKWGLKLKSGTASRLSFDVRDDISTVSIFNIKAYGFIMTAND